MDPDAKDFLLHLYDKLWENMGRKEGRLWNYLSIYGAAIALALGVGQYSGAGIYGVLIALALTVWAVLIVINANWWYQRNRLMVTQIEKRFASSGALDGVVPKSYQNAIFQFDRLYRGSMLILVSIAFFIYIRTMVVHSISEGTAAPDPRILTALVYAVFLISILYCVGQHESYIRYFYSSKKQILEEDVTLSQADKDSALKAIPLELRKAIRNYSWLWPGLLVMGIVMSTFDYFPGKSAFHTGHLGCLGAACQVVVLACYVGGANSARRWIGMALQIGALVFIVGSVLLFLYF